MTEEMEMKLGALLENAEELKAVFVDDAEQTLANLAARGIEITREEMEDLREGIKEGLGSELEGGELSEKDLENVAGGYALICTKCGKRDNVATRIGVTAFFLKHRHGKKGGYAAYDTKWYCDAMKWGLSDNSLD